MPMIHRFAQKPNEDFWFIGPLAYPNTALMANCITAANASLRTLTLANASDANGNAISIDWAGDIGPPYALTQKTGDFHTWQDCGRTAETILGVPVLDKDSVVSVRAGGAVRALTKGVDREDFIRRVLAGEPDLGDNANPQVGQAFLRVIPSTVKVSSGYRYHWGSVIMKSNGASAAQTFVVTLENGAMDSANQMTCDPQVHVYGVVRDNAYNLPTFSAWLGESAKTIVVARKTTETRTFSASIAPANPLKKKLATTSSKGKLECVECGGSLTGYSYTVPHARVPKSTMSITRFE